MPITEQLKTPPPPPPSPPAPEVIEIEVEDDFDDVDVPFAIIEEVPIFSGCEDVTKSEQKECFQKMIFAHINKTVRYPEIAQ